MTDELITLPRTPVVNGVLAGVYCLRAEALNLPAVRALICEAEVVLARNTTTGRYTPAFGSEMLRSITRARGRKKRTYLRAIGFDYTPGTEELELVVAAVCVCKGSCDIYTPKPGAVEDPSVTVLDPKTGERAVVPASSLEPGMVRMRLDDTGDEVWVREDQIKYRQEPVRPSFSPETREKFRRFAQTFRGVDPKTAEQWEEGFRRDTDAEREIAFWEHIERCFRRYAPADMPCRKRSEIYRLIVVTTANGPEYAAVHYRPRGMTAERAREIAWYVSQTLRAAAVEALKNAPTE